MVKSVLLPMSAIVDLRNFGQILQEMMITRPGLLGQMNASTYQQLS